MRVIETVGVASCSGASNPGCRFGPEILRCSRWLQELEQSYRLRLDWRKLLYPKSGLSPEQTVTDLCCRIARYSRALIETRTPFIFVGGDHSSAMGIWGGVIEGLISPDLLGLIWIDAHLDAHNFATSQSCNIHGMPLAALLGQADPPLARIYRGAVLPPRNLVVLGVRSYEQEERELMQRLRVRVYDMAAVKHSGGLSLVMAKVVADMQARGLFIGVSIDLDAVDPKDAPGVGTPVAGGLKGEALCVALQQLRGHPRLLGLELAEFNPSKDLDQRTEILIANLIGSVYGSAVAHKGPSDFPVSGSDRLGSQ